MFDRMDRRRPRALKAFVLLTAALWIASTGVAQAAYRTSSGGTQFACNGGLCITAAFYARWNVVSAYGEGSHYYEVTNLNPYGVLPQAYQAATTLGVEPQSGIKVEALNSSGSVVTTISLSQGQWCPGNGASSGNDMFFPACRTYVELPLTVTKLRFTIKIVDPAKFGTGWLKTWTASLT